MTLRVLGTGARVRLLLTLLIATTTSVAAQAPAVQKVEPPNWWAGHSINPVRVLVRGTNLTGARASCGRLTCVARRVNAAGTYAFVDVTIPNGTPAGSYPITLRTSSGTVAAPFMVTSALPRAGRFQGFGP